MTAPLSPLPAPAPLSASLGPLAGSDGLMESVEAIAAALRAGLLDVDIDRATTSLVRARDLARALADTLDDMVGDADRDAQAPATASSRSSAPLALSSLAGRHVLVVDDNGLSLTIMERLLERAGLSVTAAGGGAEALSLLQERSFDAVLMDVYMPGMNGTETARRIHEDPRLSQLAVVAMSASDDHGERALCAAAGMRGFVSKPVDPADLAAALHAALGLDGR